MALIPRREANASSSAILRVGLLYYAIVFTIAFGMGVARMMLLAPRLGSTAAVLLEVPILVLISWLAARRLFRDAGLTLSRRAASGAVAFTLTMASEAAFSSIVSGQSVGGWAASVLTPLGLVGLTGQVAFGAMPMFVSRDQEVLGKAI